MSAPINLNKVKKERNRASRKARADENASAAVIFAVGNLPSRTMTQHTYKNRFTLAWFNLITGEMPDGRVPCYRRRQPCARPAQPQRIRPPRRFSDS